MALRGECGWNERGGVVHWTNRDPDGRRAGGWIDHRGRRYEWESGWPRGSWTSVNFRPAHAHYPGPRGPCAGVIGPCVIDPWVGTAAFGPSPGRVRAC